jgi:hypothetical protein
MRPVDAVMIHATAPGRKHQALMVAMVAMLVAQPLVGHASVAAERPAPSSM